MVKYIKNCDTVPRTWVGQEIAADGYYQIQSSEDLAWSSNTELLGDLISGEAKVALANDGTQDISDPNQGIDVLKNLDPTPRDPDDAPMIRTKVSPIGWTYQMFCFEFVTSTFNSVYAKDAALADFGYTTQKYYNTETVECPDQTDADANCIKTVIDWEPTHDYELIGGRAGWHDVVTSDIRLWAVGVPDIPAAYGGSKLMISNCNLKHMGEMTLVIDGRATKRLSYSATYHTNKMRFVVRHGAGVKLSIQIVMETYKL
jgi:hypothetical protein